MSYKVTTLRGLTTRGCSWLVLLWNDTRSEAISKEAAKTVDSISGTLGGKVGAVQSDDVAGAQKTTHDDLLSLNWPEGIKERLEKTQAPVILVWAVNYDDFDPHQHRWFAIFLDRVGKGKLFDAAKNRLIREITRATTSEGLFEAFDQIAAQPFAPFNVDGFLVTSHHLPIGVIADLSIRVAKPGRPPTDWPWFRDAFAKLSDDERQLSKKALESTLLDLYRASGAGGKAPALKTLTKYWHRISGEN
jgi:hypothetical protein